MATPLRIAFVSMHTSPADQPGHGDAGGMNVVELSLARALAARGHQVDLITRAASPHAPSVAQLAPGLRLRHLPAGPAMPLPKSRIDEHLDEFRTGLERLDRYQLVHSHHWMSGVAALPVARGWGVPHVQSYHSVAALPGSPLSEGEPAESVRRVSGEARVALGSDAVVTVSTSEARTVIERCGAQPHRVHVIAPGVDHQLFRPATPGEQSSVPGPWDHAANGYLVFAARLQPLKAPDLAIRALAGVPEALRPQLVVAGDTSADFMGYRAELDELVAELGLAGHVSFTGPQPREQLAGLLRGAKAVLVPSHSETFGLLALEAAASGTPVIASAAGGLREAVVDGETGILMAGRDPDQWAAALSGLLASRRLGARMGVVAQVHARRFSWRQAAGELVHLYDQLLIGATR